MATKSVYKEIRVKDKKFCRSIVSALENAQRKRGNEVVLSKSVRTIPKDSIKEFLGGKK